MPHPNPNHKNNEQNLRVPTSEQARKNGRAGGIASARARQQRKSMRETAEIILKMPMKDGPIDQISGIESIQSIMRNKGQDVNLTVQDMTVLAMLRKAMKGDVRAMAIILELTGEQSAPVTTSPLEALAEKMKKYKDEEE